MAITTIIGSLHIFILNYNIRIFPTRVTNSVALRKNGHTIVSGMSNTGGHNPVFQSTLLHLRIGDAVQLEVNSTNL